MDLRELVAFIEIEDKRLRERYGNYPDQEKRILARTVKLSEEVGELCDAILAFNDMQRLAKLKDSNRKDLSEEFADVLITTLLIAKAMNVDVVVALKNKIVKLNKRHKRE